MYVTWLNLQSGEMVKCLVQKRVITSLVIHKDRIYIAGYEEVVRCLDIEVSCLKYPMNLNSTYLNCVGCFPFNEGGV